MVKVVKGVRPDLSLFLAVVLRPARAFCPLCRSAGHIPLKPDPVFKVSVSHFEHTSYEHAESQEPELYCNSDMTEYARQPDQYIVTMCHSCSA